MLYYKNILRMIDEGGGGGGGSTKIVVDYQALQKAKLEDDLKTLKTAKEEMEAARAAAVKAVGGESNSVGKEVDAKLAKFDGANFDLAIAEIQKIIDSMKTIGDSYAAAHAGLAADIAAINIEGLDDGSDAGGTTA